MKLLDYTRRIFKLNKSVDAWRTLVEKSNNSKLIKIINLCTYDEMKYIGHFAVMYNKYNFLKYWLNSYKLMKPNIEDIIYIIRPLHLYRIKRIKSKCSKLLHVILKSKVMKDIYFEILNWEEINDEGYTENFEELEDIPKLRVMLIDICTGLPNGASLLFNEWSIYDYNIKKVWGVKLNFGYQVIVKKISNEKINYIFDMYYDTYEKIYETDDDIYPVHRICRYGNLNDFKIAINLCDLWVNSSVFICILLNKNLKVFDYFIDLINMHNNIIDNFPYLIKKKIWDNIWISKFIKIEPINNINIPEPRYKLLLLNKYFPTIFTNKNIHNWFHINSLIYVPMELSYTSYNCFVDGLDDYKINNHKKKNEVIEYFNVLNKNSNVVSRIHMKSFHSSLINEKWYPYTYLHYNVKYYEIKAGDITIIYIDDVDINGKLDERINKIGYYHPYWNGPYSLDDKKETLDLSNCINNAKSKGEKFIWWVNSTYSLKDLNDLWDYGGIWKICIDKGITYFYDLDKY